MLNCSLTPVPVRKDGGRGVVNGDVADSELLISCPDTVFPAIEDKI